MVLALKWLSSLFNQRLHDLRCSYQLRHLWRSKLYVVSTFRVELALIDNAQIIRPICWLASAMAATLGFTFQQKPTQPRVVKPSSFVWMIT
jgi:hypothetical protein